MLSLGHGSQPVQKPELRSGRIFEAGEPSCVQQDAGSTCFGKQAADAQWSVSVDFTYNDATNETVYTFEVDAISSGCGIPDSLSVRLRDQLPALKAVQPAASVQAGCDRSSGLRSTLKWNKLKLDKTRAGYHSTTLKVVVAGEVPDLCQSGVHIVDEAGHTVVESSSDQCSFVISSQRCCRHSFADLALGL